MMMERALKALWPAAWNGIKEMEEMVTIAHQSMTG